MQKIKIRLPATLTHLGPGYNSLGLALSLYTSVEISARDDHQFIVDTAGEGAGDYPIGLRHPVALGMMRFFQREERAPLGVHIRVKNDIPLASGLGAEAAFMTAGVLGANNLLRTNYDRPTLLKIASEVTGSPYHTVTALLGGLTAAIQDDSGLLHRSLPLSSFKLIVVVPTLTGYQAPLPRDPVSLSDVVHNLQRLPLLLEAFRVGDLDLLARALDDTLYEPRVRSEIGGFQHVAEVARLAGALAVTTSGSGPALIVIATRRHNRIAEAIEAAFANIGTPARTWVVPTDAQGVVISQMQTV